MDVLDQLTALSTESLTNPRHPNYASNSEDNRSEDWVDSDNVDDDNGERGEEREREERDRVAGGIGALPAPDSQRYFNHYVTTNIDNNENDDNVDDDDVDDDEESDVITGFVNHRHVANGEVRGYMYNSHNHNPHPRIDQSRPQAQPRL